MTGLTPLDLMRKSKVQFDCEVCEETIVTWADATEDLGSQVADVYLMHLLETHIKSLPVEFDDGFEIGQTVAEHCRENIESGYLSYHEDKDQFVIESDEERPALLDAEFDT